MDLLSWILVILVGIGFLAAVIYLIRRRGACSCSHGSTRTQIHGACSHCSACADSRRCPSCQQKKQ